jgi:hypothetical protein
MNVESPVSVVMHPYNLNLQRLRHKHHELEASLGCTGRSWLKKISI